MEELWMLKDEVGCVLEDVLVYTIEQLKSQLLHTEMENDAVYNLYLGIHNIIFWKIRLML